MFAFVGNFVGNFVDRIGSKLWISIKFATKFVPEVSWDRSQLTAFGHMRTAVINSILGLGLVITGCSKQASAPTASASSVISVAQPALTAWQQGDKSTAVANFAETDWNSGPLFPSNSPLSLSEKEFTNLSDAERQSRSAEMMSQVDGLKRLAAAVAQEGRNALAKGDTTQARKYFTALKQCGTALDSPDRLRLVQLIGQGLKKTAEAELSKLRQ